MSLVLNGITHRYGDGRPVLDNVDLEVATGETIAIIGPSGSGKTTLLSIMGGLLPPTNGMVEFDGRAHSARAPGRITWVFQGINLLGHRTVADNVALGLWAVEPDLGNARDAVRVALESVGLADVAKMRAMRLSGGQAQRVGIARAMVGRPGYVIADEPTGQLDHATSGAIATLLVSERPAGTSVVVATHDLDLAARCSRRLSLTDGRLHALP